MSIQFAANRSEFRRAIMAIAQSVSAWGQWGSRGVWQVPSVAANNDHEARFPDEIPRRLIRLLSDPGDVILDPFAGSGTTLRVAADLGRRWIGFEIDPKWASTASHAAREASLRSLSA
jgi:DNA modification methylase